MVVYGEILMISKLFLLPNFCNIQNYVRKSQLTEIYVKNSLNNVNLDYLDISS